MIGADFYLPAFRQGKLCGDCHPKHGCTMNCGPSSALIYSPDPDHPTLDPKYVSTEPIKPVKTRGKK